MPTDAARLLASSRKPGTLLFAPTNVANILRVEPQAIADLVGVDHATLLAHPDMPKVQATLRDIMRVVVAAWEIQPDVQHAIALAKSEPILALGGWTLLELVRERRTEDALAYLRSLSAGFTG